MTSTIWRDICFKKNYSEVFSGSSIRTLFWSENESVWQVMETIRWSDPSIVVHFDVKQQKVTRTTQDIRKTRKRGWIGSSISCSILFMCCFFNGPVRRRNAHRRACRTFICLGINFRNRSHPTSRWRTAEEPQRNTVNSTAALWTTTKVTHTELDVCQRSSERQQILRTDGRTALHTYNERPGSSETDGINMSMVYLHSGARYVFRNSFLLHHYSASQRCWRSLKQYWKAFPGMLQSSLSWPSEDPEYQHSDGLSMLVSVVGIRKYRKVTNLENMTHAADKSSLKDNAVCGLALSCWRKHFIVVHNSGRRRHILPRKHCSIPFVNTVVYSIITPTTAHI